MKIEEIKKGEDKNSKLPETDSYWFPLSKGFNRLLIVFCIAVIIFTALATDNEDKIIGTVFFTLLIEVGAYFAFVWIFRGFEDSRKE